MDPAAFRKGAIAGRWASALLAFLLPVTVLAQVPAASYFGVIGASGPPAPCPGASAAPFQCAWDQTTELSTYVAEVTVSGGERPQADVIAELTGFAGNRVIQGRVTYGYAVRPRSQPPPATMVPIRVRSQGEAMADASGGGEVRDASASATAFVSVAGIQGQASVTATNASHSDSFVIDQVVVVPIDVTGEVDVQTVITVDAAGGFAGAQAVADPEIVIDPSFPFASSFFVEQSENLTMPALEQPSPPELARMCAPITLRGSGISPTSLLKAFLATSSGAVDLTPDPLPPSSSAVDAWTGTLPCPFGAGPEGGFGLGQGFIALELLDGPGVSNVIGLPLVGNDAAGIPSLLAVNGTLLSATSWDPSVAVANVEEVVVPGASVTLAGEGYASPLVNIFTAAGNCGPVSPTSTSPTELSITVPPSCVEGPGSLQVVNAEGAFRASNAVSVPIGADVDVTGVDVQGGRVTVQGAGFSVLTVLNLFAIRQSSGQLENFGGIAGGAAVIAFDLASPGELAFDLPQDIAPGAAFVEAVNPPFIEASRSGAGGAFTVP